MPFSRRVAKAVALLICVAAVALCTHAIWMRWLGDFLVHEDPLVKADAVLVLGGDWNGDRVLKGAELVKQGYAPLVLVSGPMDLYGINEAELAIDFAVRKGYPRSTFAPMISVAFSTRDEAMNFGPQLHARGIRRLLIVTSNFHTRRAGRIFRKGLGPEFELHMVSSPDRHFNPDGWWNDREAQKTFFFEFTKTIASSIGL